jgi:Flp pilus assembly protein TadD
MNDTDLLRRAISEFEAGRTETAEADCRRILREHPNHAEALHVCALCAARLGRRPEALALLERAVDLAPGHAQYHYNLGVTLQELGLSDEAMLAYRACLRLQPDLGDALWNYGDLLRLNEHFEEAVACFERIIALGRSYPELHHRLGVALHGLEQNERAATAFEKALAEPGGDKALTHWEYCHVLLTQGRFAEGWDAYDQRFAAGYRTTVTCYPFPQPRWEGQALKDKSLLVHGEQGLGDEIMFASIIPELIGEGARVILACQPPLVRLFAESFPSATVRAHQAVGRPADVSDLEPIDYQITFGSVPGQRRRCVEDFGRNKPYISADPEATTRFRERLRGLRRTAGDKLKVGLTWGSNPATGVDWASAAPRTRAYRWRHGSPLLH